MQYLHIRDRVFINSIRRIAVGKEITCDYCLYNGGDDPNTCNCGAEEYRGRMYSKTELQRRKRAPEKGKSIGVGGSKRISRA